MVKSAAHLLDAARCVLQSDHRLKRAVNLFENRFGPARSEDPILRKSEKRVAKVERDKDAGVEDDISHVSLAHGAFVVHREGP